MRIVFPNDVAGPGVFFAHTLAGKPPTDWQELAEHLTGVALRAGKAAAAFDAEDFGRTAGLWHDVGKYSTAFQAYLNAVQDPDGHVADTTRRIDHSTAGAQHAVTELGIVGHLLAFVLAGHHSGLLDSVGDGPSLRRRLNKAVEEWSAAPAEITDQRTPDVPGWLGQSLATQNAFTVQFFVRMLFSCLVDADFLDTETFMQPDKAGARPEWPADILEQMRSALGDHLDAFGPPATEVNERRAEVLQACRDAAGQTPGFFTLTVPTGGGKTLSSLAFSLDHAIAHDLRRVIYVVPFTSIIEQNVDVFRDVLAPITTSGTNDPVVEHHSDIDLDRETTATRLAAENWDAPLIVTTSVQFYESLFANRASRCRKLHNLARSVVILDEAQALPVDYLEPCLKALRELTENYGATVVLCTATQPAIRRRKRFPIGLDVPATREIVREPAALYSHLKRVDVERMDRVVPDEELADLLAREDQVLCIVNTRRHAQQLATLLGEDENHVHLSALMCPEHRSVRLGEIRRRLEDGRPCRVVSTQLVEAGVDIDFPVVYRSMTGLDSIAQAAGRCNRNGTIPRGRTVVFDSEHQSTEVFLRDTAAAAREVMPLYGDPLALDAIEHYFRLYYWDQSVRWDAKHLCREFELQNDPALPFLFGFARTASRMRLIEDAGQPVIVPWREEGERLCRELRESWRGQPSVSLRRRLQRYMVRVPLSRWRGGFAHTCEIIHDLYAVLISTDLHYSDWTGLRTDVGLDEALMR